jgi:hypothetical protein
MKKEELGKAATKSFQMCFANHYDWLGFLFWQFLTAVGMTNGVEGALYIMITVVISVLIMMQFAVPVGSFVNKILRYKFWVCPFNSYGLCYLQKVLTYQMH